MSKTTVHSVAGAFGRSASADASPPCCATSDGGCFLAAVVQVICLAGFARPEGRVEKGRLSDINQALQVCAPISLRVLQSSIWATFWPLVEAFCLQSLNGVQSEAATTACFCGTTTTAAAGVPQHGCGGEQLLSLGRTLLSVFLCLFVVALRRNDTSALRGRASFERIRRATVSPAPKRTAAPRPRCDGTVRPRSIYERGPASGRQGTHSLSRHEAKGSSRGPINEPASTSTPSSRRQQKLVR